MTISESLQEVVLVEHYAANLPLKCPRLAAWAKEFSEFQHSSQLPWLPPVKLAPPGPVAFDLIQSTAELPRIFAVGVRHDPVEENWYHGSIFGAGLKKKRLKEIFRSAAKELISIDQKEATRLDPAREHLLDEGSPLE